PFDVTSMQGAVDRCLAWCTGPRKPHTIITANAATVCMTQTDPGLRQACLEADLVVPDGMSVVWTSWMTKEPFPERVTGVDLMTRLLEKGSQGRLRVYFLGATHQVVSRLVERCAERHPGLVVCGYRDGYFSPEEQAAIVEQIRELAPDLLFVGMPSPFKETFCQRNRER